MESDCLDAIRDPMQWIDELLPQLDGRDDRLGETRELLGEIEQSAYEASQRELEDFAVLLSKLVDLLERWHDDLESPEDDAKQLWGFVAAGLTTIRAAVNDEPETLERMEQLACQAAEQWGEYLGLLEEPHLAGTADELDAWSHDGQADVSEAELADADIPLPTVEEISQILSQVGSVAHPSSELPSESEMDKTTSDRDDDDAGAATHDTEISEELREAFLDDAGRCVSSMEEALLAYEANPKDRQPLQQVCRELHTLKGASGSVGLSELAEYLHGVEDTIRDSERSDGPAPSVESLLEALEIIRQRIGGVTTPRDKTIGPTTRPDDHGNANVASAVPAALADFGEAPGDDASLRVKTSQLDRLMDMLAELVMLRNRRDGEMSELQEVHENLVHSVSRLRVLGDGRNGAVENGQPPGRLTEVANDILDAAQRLRESYQPVSAGNLAISRFIRQFRQELVELRRMPVSGLFRRLRRVIRDAARAEGKQVHLRLLGEDAGIERSLQERLYEPLLHVVRNAVSHGIEGQEVRQRQGKTPVGNITLEARTGPDLLVIEIRDDGRGLDYDALRRRGIALGFLSPDKAASQEELAQLIFRPGFSTRQEASQVSGRGVGMDVVAATLARLRGWVEVDSTPGQGTTFRLMFPLPSVIQHTMVFRAAGQMFALPMQFVQGAGDSDDLLAVRFSELFHAEDTRPDAPRQLLVLACETPSSDPSDDPVRRVAFLVDEIVGPEEVVVRPMPSLLKHHPLCSGATLSGMGVVLVLDARRLVELGVRHTRSEQQAPSAAPSADGSLPSAAAPRVLVVDDSISARKRLVRSLRRYDFEIVEAGDGAEALEMLKSQRFDAVFSDLEMPRLGGFELLQEINHNGHEPGPPVVLVTSRGEDEFQRRAAELGAVDYLTKPLADEALDQALENLATVHTCHDETFHQPSTE